MEPITVIFEGVDKTGKSTLKEAFNERTNFKNFVIDRGPISNIVYNKLFNRLETDNDYFYEMLEIFKQTKCMIVFCISDENIIKNRLIEHKEVFPENINIKDTEKCFFSVIHNSDMNYVIVDTSKLTIDECVDNIINSIKLIKKV